MNDDVTKIISYYHFDIDGGATFEPQQNPGTVRDFSELTSRI